MRVAAPPRPWVKVCGVTRPEDAALAMRLGAAFVGVNFWSGSKRRVELGAAREIRSALAEVTELVGVFVNEDPNRIAEVVATVGLDRIQLHGDESDEVVARFAARAFRALRAEGRVVELLDACSNSPAENATDARSACDSALERTGLSLQWKASAVVLDSGSAGQRFGGTGEAWCWSRAAGLCAASPTPILIAGGVGPETAREILDSTGAAGIDVASGIERSPGVKDRGMMERLFEEVSRVRRDETT